MVVIELSQFRDLRDRLRAALNDICALATPITVRAGHSGYPGRSRTAVAGSLRCYGETRSTRYLETPLGTQEMPPAPQAAG